MGGKKSLFNLIGIFLLLVVITTTGALCQQSGEMPEETTLKYWRVFDEKDDFQEVIASFEQKYPYIKIEMKIVSSETYEEELLDAWVKGEGPDIFSVPNNWMGKYKEYIKPLPETVGVSTITVTERLGKQDVNIAKQDLRTISLSQLNSQFVDVVYDDVVFADKEDENKDKIYGLPLSIDTLALYYNKDLLNQAEIINPPKTWGEFVDNVKETTAISVNGELVRSGAALGTVENVPRGTDILALLMMQNGTIMADGSRVNFAHESDSQSEYFPGIKALEFYTSFSQKDKESYSWNNEMPDALEQFIQGNLAFFIGYNYQLELIREQAPNLNFDFTTVPQVNPTAKANYAYYWVETVARNAESPDMSWHFVEYLTQEAQAQKYLESSQRPAALRSLLAVQKEETDDLKPWVEQALTARSWYYGAKPEVVEESLTEAIEAMLTGLGETKEILTTAENKIELTYTN